MTWFPEVIEAFEELSRSSNGAAPTLSLAGFDFHGSFYAEEFHARVARIAWATVATVGTLPEGLPRPDVPWTDIGDVGQQLLEVVQEEQGRVLGQRGRGRSCGSRRRRRCCASLRIYARGDDRRHHGRPTVRHP